jgi:sugar diacid utilization regulator
VSSQERIRSLQEIAEVINSTSDLGTVLDRLVLAVCRHTNWSTSSIMAVDTDASRSYLLARFDPELAEDARVASDWSLETSPARLVVETRKPIVIPDARVATEFPGYREDALARDYATVVICPLRTKDLSGRSLVLAVHAQEVTTVDIEQLTFLDAVCHLGSIAMDRAARIGRERDRISQIKHIGQAGSQLMARVLAHASTVQIISDLEELCDCAVILVDALARSIAAGRSPDPTTISDADWAVYVSQDLSVATLSARLRTIEEIRTVEALFVGGPDTVGKLRATAVPLRVERELVGWLLLINHANLVSEVDQLQLEQAKSAGSVFMLRIFERSRAKTISHAELFRQLVTGDWRDREELMRRAKDLDLNLGAPWQLEVLIAHSSSSNGGSRPRFFELDAAVAERVARQLSLAFIATTDLGYAIVTPLGGSVRTRPHWDRRPRQAIVDELEQTLSIDIALVRFGKGEGPEAFRSVWTIAQRLTPIVNQLRWRGVFNESEFGPEAALFAAADRTVLERYAEQVLSPIVAHDSGSRAKLLPTLSAFLRGGCRMQACADHLGIHVTTLRYRLEQINELLGYELEEPSRRFGLELATQIIQAIGNRIQVKVRKSSASSKKLG